MRSLLAAVAVTALCASVPAEAAPGPAAFTGTMHVDCFGCGVTHADADLIFTPGGSAYGSFIVYSQPGATCRANWTFNGTIDFAAGGYIDVSVVVVADVMTITGVDDDAHARVGGGYAIFTSGVACGASADFTIVGVI